MAIERSEGDQSGGVPWAQDLAAITETARDYIESWLQIAKIGDRWAIANVLWKQHEGETQP